MLWYSIYKCIIFRLHLLITRLNATYKSTNVIALYILITGGCQWNMKWMIRQKVNAFTTATASRVTEKFATAAITLSISNHQIPNAMHTRASRWKSRTELVIEKAVVRLRFIYCRVNHTIPLSMISLLWWWSVYVLVLAAAVSKIAAENVQLSAYKDSSTSLSSASSLSAASSAHKSTESCGGMLTATQGVIRTPNFPNKFPVPIQCTWIIDASSINKQNVSIIVYFTQQFVLSGLKFTEYDYYSDDIKVKSDHTPFELNDQTVTQVSWVRFYSQFLEIKFTMDNLYGTHLRALDRLLDVYGFNITYEMDGIVKPYQCNALLCRYLGHCHATENFS